MICANPETYKSTKPKKISTNCTEKISKDKTKKEEIYQRFPLQ